MLLVLSGTAGVGKSALAAQFLHDDRRDFSDGQLFVSLGGSSLTPVAPADALEWLLLSLGVAPEKIPLELSPRAALYRTETAMRRVVVVLDDAVSAAQVRPLLPVGDQCLTVVTSRFRLSGLAMNGARWVEVGPLDSHGSVAVLEGILGTARVAAESAAALELARLCGGLPLALSIVAARLSTRPRRSLAREVTDLTGERRRLSALALDDSTSVEAVLDLGYAGLVSDAERLYRICALHPGREFGAGVAAAGCGWSAQRTESALEELLEAHFLVEVGEDRFTYHDLLRVHARHLAQTEDDDGGRHAVVERMVEWYVDQAVLADLAIHPLRPRLGPRRAAGTAFRDSRAALDWAERERSNFRSALDSAIEHDRPDLAWQLCEALWGVFLHTRHYGDWIYMHRVGIGAAQQLGERRAEARLRSQLGFAYAKLRRFDEATTENRVALQLAEAEQDPQAQATALSQLGRAARGTGDLPAALDYFRRARELQDGIGEVRGVALCRRRIGQILSQLGRYDEALSELDAAAAIMHDLGDSTQFARTLLVLGMTHLHAGSVARAHRPLREALGLIEEFGSPYHQAEILAALGDVEWRQGDAASARTRYERARDLYEAAEDPRADAVRARLRELPESPG